MGLLRRIKNTLLPRKYGWFGNYPSWEEAEKHTVGYNDEGIFEKVKNASLQVKKGEAAYERDSVLFYEPAYDWVLLSHLSWIAAQNRGRLNLVDFGGALGSSYFQHKKYFDAIPDLTWNIVEQARFIEIGRKEFEDDRLRFFNSINEITTPDVVLLNCVLPYIKDPYELLRSIADKGPAYIIIHSTPFQELAGKDIITVQKVNPVIYRASYPCRLMDPGNVSDALSGRYTSIHRSSSGIQIHYYNHSISYLNMVFKRS